LNTPRTVLEAVGNTPLVELRRVVPAGSARVVVKLESSNPTGGMKDRVAKVGIGFVPPLWRRDAVDEVVGVSTADAKAMARRLAREEAIFGGTSSGANVIAALAVALRLGPGATVGTIIVDSGLRYLSTDVFKRRA